MSNVQMTNEQVLEGITETVDSILSMRDNEHPSAQRDVVAWTNVLYEFYHNEAVNRGLLNHYNSEVDRLRA